MKAIVLMLLLFTNALVFSQEPQYFRLKKKIKHAVITPRDNNNLVILQLSGLFETAKKVTYVDTANGYEALVPKWLRLRETNSLDFFGGTLPAINEVENAIVINSMPLNQYNSFSDFKKYIIEDSTYSKDKSPKWANDRVFVSIEKETLLHNKFSSNKFSVNRQGNIFVCNYVLIQTKKAYLLVQFTATEETYDFNISKFHEFLKGIKFES